MRDPRFALLRAPARGVVPSNPRAVDDALAKARTLAEGPIDFHHLEVARSELGDRFHCWEPFHEGFIRHIRAVPERQSTWVGIFENRFIAARDDLPSKALLISEQSSFSAVRESWQEETNPFVVWERLPDVHLFLDELRDATQMLIQLDVARGLEALDSLPFPSIMRGLLGRTFIEDRDIIEEMIKSAPAVFDDQGAWVKNRNVSALLVTDLILQHANALAQEHKNVVWAGRVQIGHDSMKTAATEHALKELREKEIPEWFVSAFEQLLQRPDGQRIAIGYIVHLSRQVLLGKGLLQDPNDPWSVDGVALNALTMVVGRSVGILAQLRNAWGTAEQYAAKKDADDAKRRRVQRAHIRRRDDRYDEGIRSLHTDGLPWLVGASRILLTQKNSAIDDVKTFWSWFVELLERRDPGLSLVRHGASFVDIPLQFGYLLSRLDSAHSHWQTAYAALEPQRRRAMFGHQFVNETHPDLGSILLLRVALNAIVQFANQTKDAAQSAMAKNWFYQVYQAARRLWLTAVLDVGQKKRAVVTVCFAFMPQIFGNTLSEALGQTIAPIANEPTMLAEACAYLHANGVELPRLRALVDGAGGDLETALRDAQQWAELSGDNRAFPEHLQSFARELGLDFSKPLVTPR